METQRVNIPILDKLVATGNGPSPTTGGVAATKALASFPIIVPPLEPVDDIEGSGTSETIGTKGDDAA